jgi:hypothetical protein
LGGGLAGGLLVSRMLATSPVTASVPAVSVKAENISHQAPPSLTEPKDVLPATVARTEVPIEAADKLDGVSAPEVDGLSAGIVSLSAPRTPLTQQPAVQNVVLGNDETEVAEAPRKSPFEGALAFALEAADPYVKEGYTVREDHWGGQLQVKQPKAIVHQLFKGNEYWFWMGTDTEDSKITVHVYDADGRLAETESWQKPHKAAAKVVAKKTGTHYLIVEIEKSPKQPTAWTLAYGFK